MVSKMYSDRIKSLCRKTAIIGNVVTQNFVVSWLDWFLASNWCTSVRVEYNFAPQLWKFPSNNSSRISQYKRNTISVVHSRKIHAKLLVQQQLIRGMSGACIIPVILTDHTSQSLNNVRDFCQNGLFLFGANTKNQIFICFDVKQIRYCQWYYKSITAINRAQIVVR